MTRQELPASEASAATRAETVTHAVPAYAQTVRWWHALLVLLFIFGVPALFREQKLTRLPFDKGPVAALRKIQPEGVLVGDSMLGSRIDGASLDKLSGLRCAVLAYPGSGTALWYLVVKNVVAPQPHPPRWLIILFRDKQLTMAGHRTGDRYRNGLEACMVGDEPEFSAILNQTRTYVKPWPERTLETLYLLQRKRQDWRKKMQFAALKAVAAQPERASIREASAEILRPAYTLAAREAINTLNGEVSLQLENHDFRSEVEKSFLPLILAVARQHQIHPLFYRVKRRPEPNGSTPADSANMQQYMQALHEYLDSHGAALVDETVATEVTANFYGGDDHVRGDMMPTYTQLFWSKVAPVLRGLENGSFTTAK